MIIEMDISKEDFGKLKKLYTEAVENKRDSFIFMGQEILTSYAKYLIEYLEGKFK